PYPVPAEIDLQERSSAEELGGRAADEPHEPSERDPAASEDRLARDPYASTTARERPAYVEDVDDADAVDTTRAEDLRARPEPGLTTTTPPRDPMKTTLTREP